MSSSYTAGMALAGAGAALFLGAYVWAFVLASRAGRRGNWLLGLFFAGALVYPVLAYRHWPLMRRNCAVLVAGIVGIAIGVALVAAARP